MRSIPKIASDMGVQDIDFASITSLCRNGDGIWHRVGDSAVSYPSENHDHRFEVEDGSWWYAHRANLILGQLQRFPPAGWVLDIGGGNGFMTSELASNGYPAVLLNPAGEGISNARRRGVETAIQATFETCEFRSGSVPAAALFDVLEHVRDRAGFLTALHDALATRGHLYLTVPAYSWLWSRYDDLAGHLARFTLGRLHDELQNAGFEIRFSSYCFLPLVLPQALARAFSYRLGWSRQVNGTALNRQLMGKRLGRVIRAMLAPETGWLARGHSLPFGSSCLVVAEAGK